MKTDTVFVLSALFLAVTLIPAVSAHQIDSVGEYRIQIGWMQEPAVSGESNGIELYVSPLNAGLPPDEQPFEDGITGLQKDLKIQLIMKGDAVTLPLREDHDIPGKYFVLVEPTVAGFYQVNILGDIGDTTVSKSLHAPRVENKTYLQFPQLPGDNTILKEEHETLKDEILQIRNSVEKLESLQATANVGYAGIGTAIAAIVVAVIALTRRK